MPKGSVDNGFVNDRQGGTMYEKCSILKDTEIRTSGGTSPVDSLVSSRWSSEIPTVPGWYWSKDHHGIARIEQVHRHMGDSLSILENTWMGWRHVPIKNMGRQWAGPIPLPAN